MNINVRKSMPTAGAVHIDKPLTQISVAYMQDEQDFIADKVFPKIPVDHQTDKYWIFSKEYFFRSQAKLRAPGTPAAQGGIGLTTGTYSCDVYAFAEVIPDQVRSNADESLDLDMAMTLNISRQLLLIKEQKFSEVAFTKANWATSVVGNATAATGKFVFWSDYTNSDPAADIRQLRMTVKKKTGIAPNTLVLPEATFETVRLHPKIRDIYKYTTNQVVTEDMLAKVFGVDNLYISKAVVTSSEEGLDDPTKYDWINKNSALLCFTTKSPAKMTPTAAYQFCWKHVGGGTGDTVIKTFRDDYRESDRIEGQNSFKFEVICSDLGVVLENLTA